MATHLHGSGSIDDLSLGTAHKSGKHNESFLYSIGGSIIGKSPDKKLVQKVSRVPGAAGEEPRDINDFEQQVTHSRAAGKGRTKKSRTSSKAREFNRGLSRASKNSITSGSSLSRD